MQHSDILINLQNLIKHKPTQQELANILGVSVSTISARAVRNSDYSAEEIKKIDKYYGVDMFKQDEWANEFVHKFSQSYNIVKNNVIADYYTEVQTSCGNGIFELSGEKEQILIPKTLIASYSQNKKYSVINATGSSMEPAIIDGDKLIIEHQDFSQVIDNRVYIFCYNEKIFCKRLILSIDRLVIKSDNADKDIYPTQYVEKEDINNVHIIGKVVGLIRKMDWVMNIN